jgi:hypothetical protein
MLEEVEAGLPRQPRTVQPGDRRGSRVMQRAPVPASVPATSVQSASGPKPVHHRSGYWHGRTVGQLDVPAAPGDPALLECRTRPAATSCAAQSRQSYRRGAAQAGRPARSASALSTPATPAPGRCSVPGGARSQRPSWIGWPPSSAGHDEHHQPRHCHPVGRRRAERFRAAGCPGVLARRLGMVPRCARVEGGGLVPSRAVASGGGDWVHGRHQLLL